MRQLPRTIAALVLVGTAAFAGCFGSGGGSPPDAGLDAGPDLDAEPGTDDGVDDRGATPDAREGSTLDAPPGAETGSADASPEAGVDAASAPDAPTDAVLEANADANAPVVTTAADGGMSGNAGTTWFAIDPAGDGFAAYVNNGFYGNGGSATLPNGGVVPFISPSGSGWIAWTDLTNTYVRKVM